MDHIAFAAVVVIILSLSGVAIEKGLELIRFMGVLAYPYSQEAAVGRKFFEILLQTAKAAYIICIVLYCFVMVQNIHLFIFKQ